MRCTGKDIDKINAILMQPDVLPWIHDDGYDPATQHFDFGAHFITAPNTFVLQPNEHSIFIYTPMNCATWLVDTNITPAGRGRMGVNAATQSMAWMFINTACKKIISWVPEFNRQAGLFARMCGLKAQGVCTQSFLKHGVLHDQVLYGITKEEFLCQPSH